MTTRAAKFYGYLYFFIATVFVLFAIRQNNLTEGWDFFTILLMAVAAIDYMIAFRYFGKAKESEKKNKKD